MPLNTGPGGGKERSGHVWTGRIKESWRKDEFSGLGGKEGEVIDHLRRAEKHSGGCHTFPQEGRLKGKARMGGETYNEKK